MLNVILNNKVKVLKVRAADISCHCNNDVSRGMAWDGVTTLRRLKEVTDTYIFFAFALDQSLQFPI